MNDVEEEIRRQMMSGQGSASAPPKPPDSKLHRMQAKGGIMGGIATALLLLLKLGAPLFAILGKLKVLAILPKILVTGGSMFVTMWFQAIRWGWPFGVGLTVLILIHECGHALAAYLRGIPIKGMLFIPFMGAMVAVSRDGKDVVEDAFIGIMGPVVGSAACAVCVFIYFVTGSPFWLVLGHWGFLINLFNLAPTPPLDGGWITPVFSPKLLALGVVVLFILMPRNPLMWLLAALSIPRIISHWKAKPDDPYFRATKSDRIRYAVAYLGLIAVLFLSMKGIEAIYRQQATQGDTLAYHDKEGKIRS
ncbi:MAG: site-2 protease family protein [Chthonomonadales bacterium]